MTLHVLGDFLPEHLDEMRPFGARPDDTRITPQNIEELGQLVQIAAPQQRPRGVTSGLLCFVQRVSKVYVV
jgi:hypothetical protein